MSYCRWSSMNFQCDLYIYESVYDCWTIHVAGRRRVGELPPDPMLSLPGTGASEEEKAAWLEAYRARNKVLDETRDEMVDIDLPHAGETFNLANPGECADKVEELIRCGYVCPDYVVPELREEQAELDAIADQSRNGRDAQRLDAKHASGGAKQSPETPVPSPPNPTSKRTA